MSQFSTDERRFMRNGLFGGLVLRLVYAGIGRVGVYVHRAASRLTAQRHISHRAASHRSLEEEKDKSFSFFLKAVFLFQGTV